MLLGTATISHCNTWFWCLTLLPIRVSWSSITWEAIVVTQATGILPPTCGTWSSWHPGFAIPPSTTTQHVIWGLKPQIGAGSLSPFVCLKKTDKKEQKKMRREEGSEDIFKIHENTMILKSLEYPQILLPVRVFKSITQEYQKMTISRTACLLP